MWRERKRLQARERLAAELWPRLWRRAGEDPRIFIDLAAHYTAKDRNWQIEAEWVRTPEDPGMFAAHQTHRPIDRAYHPLCPLCRRTDKKPRT